MSKVKVDQEKCIGCGLCASDCPSVFKMNENGKSEVIKDDGCAECDCQKIASDCPVGAISVETN